MQVHPAVRGTWSVVFSVLFLSSFSISRGQDDLPPEIDADGVQTLTRGPVHEAFASPSIADPKPNLIVTKRPPEDIREQPPEYQPEGQNVQWFPGYWSWDEDREDFIWVSGAWRDPPPGKRWVPGYWAEVPGGFQWVAGFWIDEAIDEIEYLKPPPESLEQGPSIASPGDNYQYVPGTWTYINNDYRWQTGYWAPYQEDWVYVPAQWIWTPRGCVYVAGYYDWRVPRRGQIFAPVYFSSVVYSRPSYFYRPRCIINTSNLFVHLWVRPNYCHYYFGNYYGSTYANRHFTPWCDYRPRPHCYDPLLSYCHTHYRRQGIDYVGRMKGWHNHYERNDRERPPMTYKDQIAHLHDRDRDHGDRTGRVSRQTLIAEDLKDVLRKPDHKESWKRLDVATKDRTKSNIDQVKQLHKLRLDQEKIAFVDKPGRRPGAEVNKPVSDQPDLKLPGNNRPGRPNPTGDGTKPSDEPGRVGPGKIENVVGTDASKPGKFKLPKPALATTTPVNKPVVKVPQLPDKTIVNRPNVSRPTGDEFKLPDTGNKPTRVPGLRNPENTNTAGNDQPGRINKPEVGAKVPGLGSPENTRLPNLPDKIVDRKPETKPLTGGNETRPDTKKPNLGNSSAAAAAQQRLEALRAQQQEIINRARNAGSNPSGNSAGNSLGGNKPNNVRVETPKIDIPKVERPRVNLGGSNEIRNQNGSRNVVPSNVPSVPRNFTPSVEPRNFRPNSGGNSGNISVPRNIERPSTPNVSPRINTSPQMQLRSNPTPRVEPRSNPSNSGGGNNDKRRGR